MALPSMAPKACAQPSATLPASAIVCSIFCTGSRPNGMKKGPVSGASTRSVNGESMLQGSSAPKMRGR